MSVNRTLNEGPGAPGAAAPDGRSRYWLHVRNGCAWLVGGYLLAILLAAAIVPAYAIFMAWFGLIYVIPSILSVFLVGIAATRSSKFMSRRREFVWFLLEGALGVTVTAIYSVTAVPMFSGTRVSQLLGIQLSHSVICWIASLVVAAGGLWLSYFKANRNQP